MATQSAAQLDAVVEVTNGLNALLDYARTIKLETTVDPPLPVADFIEDIKSIHDERRGIQDLSRRFATFETACREIFYSSIQSADIVDPEFVQVWDLLDIVLMCGDHGQCTPELVCWLLEELLDSQTTEGCRTVFDYLDSRRERLAQRDFHKKNLVFLRSCNELLRRLSRAEDATFCGRVFFFLFQTFPLGDKSSVNLRGEFHVENQTKFDALEQPGGSGDGDEMDVDRKAEDTSTSETKESTPQPGTAGKPGSKALPIKAPPKKVLEEVVLSTSDLYPIFWSLQHDFSEPTRLFEQSKFASFKKALASTITKFKKTPTVVQTKAGEEDKRATKRKLGESNGGGGKSDTLVDNYNPKYLTSRDLFDLELSDLAFQRHILVQALILIDFLLSLTEKAKKRLNAISASNKSMLYAFTLSDEDAKWATSTRGTITAYLSSNNEGRHYCRMVETVLARDKNWVRWKVESCPSIVRGPVSTEQEMEARTGASAYTRPRRVPERPTNAMNLDFLDDSDGDGLEALKNPARYAVPSIESLVEQVKVDKLDADFAVGDEVEQYDNALQSAKWRALRMARASDLALLDRVESSTKDLEEIMNPPGDPFEEAEIGHGLNVGEEDTTAPGSTNTPPADGSQDAEAVEIDPTQTLLEDDKVMEGVEAAA